MYKEYCDFCHKLRPHSERDGHEDVTCREWVNIWLWWWRAEDVVVFLDRVVSSELVSDPGPKMPDWAKIKLNSSSQLCISLHNWAANPLLFFAKILYDQRRENHTLWDCLTNAYLFCLIPVFLKVNCVRVSRKKANPFDILGFILLTLFGRIIWCVSRLCVVAAQLRM